MAGSPRYLTKSRFSLAMECPAKLYYTGKACYANRELDDPFLEALADGGFQVGELARRYFPAGISIDTLAYRDALETTKELLRRPSVVLFEPAFSFGDLFIRADILVKEGIGVELIEVKAASFDPAANNSFFTKKGEVLSGWKPYLYDVAFQTWVVRNAVPEWTVEPFLMMADKSSKCPTDGLNQKLRIFRDESDRKRVRISGELTSDDLGEQILVKVPVHDPVEKVLSGRTGDFARGFQTVVMELADAYRNDKKLSVKPGKHCGSCEFRTTPEERGEGLKDGFRECWEGFFDLEEKDFDKPTVLDVWNFRKKDQCLLEGRWRMDDITEDDIPKDPEAGSGLSMKQRQWLQITKAVRGDPSPFIDARGLKAEMDSWKYPLHFIDFETAMTAIPFHKGRKPYEAIAFQFSHHIAQKDMSVKHLGQFLETRPGFFPNYEFLRALKNELEGDEGTILRYGAHENTYLNHIVTQLEQDPAPPGDASELVAFARQITHWYDEDNKRHEGPRNMIDMLNLVKRYYYDPAMGGSNSIKYVLPAILNSSPFLQNKYSQPMYGSKGGMPSHNFSDWAWVRFDEASRVTDPYRLLPPIFEGVDEDQLDELAQTDEEIREGGAAMTAWARMQFSEMSAIERQKISEALLKYCELDTLAMVMIWEGWREMLP